MSLIAPVDADVVVGPAERLEVLFEELSELAGQRNAIDGRIVDIVAEIDHDGLWGATGARSVPALVAWKLGLSSANAATIAAVAHRLPEFPRCVDGLREGRLSLDQVGIIAARAGAGSDEHYAQLARSGPPSRRDHPHRPRRRSHRHRQRRPITDPRIAGTHTDSTPTRCPTVSRTPR